MGFTDGVKDSFWTGYKTGMKELLEAMIKAKEKKDWSDIYAIYAEFKDLRIYIEDACLLLDAPDVIRYLKREHRDADEC